MCAYCSGSYHLSCIMKDPKWNANLKMGDGKEETKINGEQTLKLKDQGNTPNH